MQNVIIFGASGHGKVILDSIEQQGGYHVVGFADTYIPVGQKINGYKVLGNEYDLPRLSQKYNLHGGIVAIGDNWIRRKVTEKILKINPGFRFITVIHPHAVIGKDVHVGRGTVIMPGTVINTNSWVGDFCILNTNSSLDHDSTMYNYSSLAPRVCTGGNFELGRYSAVCLGTNIIESITIGEHAVVGAGSLVVTDICSNVVAYGSPAKVIRAREAGEAYLSVKRTYTPIPFIVNAS